MRIKPLCSLLSAWTLVGWLALTPPLTALPDDWNSDFRKAREVARETGKDNLLVFTGLDWEPWSLKLRNEALEKTEFHRALANDFIVTHVNLPETPKDQEALSELDVHQYGLAGECRLHVFPSLYLCTPDGLPYGLVGYVEGGPTAVVAAIHAKKEAYAQMLEKIRRLEGPPRALAIEAWLKDLPEPLQFLHQDKMEMIVSADPHNETGLWAKYKKALLLTKAREFRYTAKLDQAETLYLEIVNKVNPRGVELQDIYYELIDVYIQRNDYDKLLGALDQAIEAAPTSARMDILNEMTDVFTRRWIYTRYKPEEMKAAEYDYKKITLPSGDANKLLELIGQARNVAPGSRRNKVLDAMAHELSGDSLFVHK